MGSVSYSGLSIEVDPTVSAQIAALDLVNSTTLANYLLLAGGTMTGNITFSDSTTQSTAGIADAPSDGDEYVRKDGAWSVVTGDGTGLADAPSDGDEYVRKDGAWAVATGGGGGGSYLPLAGGDMTGAIVFDTTGLQNINKGTFDNSTGGYNGISLTCAVGYELNWQGGRLTNWYSGSAQVIYVDSPIDITNAGGITFNDDTVQTTAALPLTGGTLTGAVNVTQINNTTNTNIDIDVYNDTGAGTHFVHSFDAYTGVFELATNGGGITFPDSTTQTTAWTGVPTPSVNQVSSFPYTLVIGDANNIVYLLGQNYVTVYIPIDATVNFPIGTTVRLVMNNCSYITVAPADSGFSGPFINNANSNTVVFLNTNGAYVANLVKVAADSWVVA